MDEELYICHIDRSLCKHCDHRITREISSEGFILTTEDGEESFDDFGSFTHDSCSKLGVELDHIVLDCNKFKPIKENSLSDNLLTNSDILNKLS